MSGVRGTGARAVVATGAVAAAGGVVIAFLLWVAGMNTMFAVAIVPMATAIGVVWQRSSGLEMPPTARHRTEPRPGTRSDIVQSAWAFRGRHGRVTDSGRKRLVTFAQSRLARCGLDLEAEADVGAIRHALGDHAHAVLMSQTPPSVTDVERYLDALERLIDTTDPTP